MKNWGTFTEDAHGRRWGFSIPMSQLTDKHLTAATRRAIQTYLKWSHDARFLGLRAYGRPSTRSVRQAREAQGYKASAATRLGALLREVQRRDRVRRRRHPRLAGQTLGSLVQRKRR